MQFLLVFLGGLLERLISYFFKKGIKNFAIVLGYITFYIGLFLTFMLTWTAAIWALQPITPAALPFALSLVPDSVFTMLNLYFSALVARRVYDWHRRATKDFTQAMLL